MSERKEGPGWDRALDAASASMLLEVLELGLGQRWLATLRREPQLVPGGDGNTLPY